MRISTQKLIPGNVMLTGEIVLSAEQPRGETFNKFPKMHIKLFNPKNGKIRFAKWNLYGTIFCKDEIVKLPNE